MFVWRRNSACGGTFSDTMFDLLDPAVHMMIPRTQPLPAIHTEIFATVVDNQTELEITVLQGESNRASQNNVLAAFELVNIPPAPCAVQQIAVTFGALLTCDGFAWSLVALSFVLCCIEDSKC